MKEKAHKKVFLVRLTPIVRKLLMLQRAQCRVYMLENINPRLTID